MILTGIGKKNFKAFSMLLGTDKLRDDELYIGAIEKKWLSVQDNFPKRKM